MSTYAMDDDMYLFAVMCAEIKHTEPGNRTWVCTAEEHSHAPDEHYWEVR